MSNIEDHLVREFQKSYPEFSGLMIGADEGGLAIASRGEEPSLWIHPYQGEWTVASPEAHGHFESKEEAFRTALGVLRGDVRFTQEFRGETLSATWLEFRDGDAFEVRNMAAFLSPFEADEWELWPGEEWKQVRTTRRYSPVSQTVERKVQDRFSTESSSKDSKMLGWLADGLGPPADGMLWAVGPYSRFVFQKPKGWRRRVFEEQKHYQDFSPGDEGWMFRAQTYFRPTERRLGKRKTEAVWPGSTEYAFDESGPDWAKHSWTMTFSDGEEDMMGILELFHLRSLNSEAEPLRERVAATVETSLFVPTNWNMRPPG